MLICQKIQIITIKNVDTFKAKKEKRDVPVEKPAPCFNNSLFTSIFLDSTTSGLVMVTARTPSLSEGTGGVTARLQLPNQIRFIIDVVLKHRDPGPQCIQFVGITTGGL